MQPKEQQCECVHSPLQWYTTVNQTILEHDVGETEKWLRAYGLSGYRTDEKGEVIAAAFGQYNIRADTGIVDVPRSVTLDLPVTPPDINWVGMQFGRVNGSFSFGNNPTITSLKGVPRIIGGDLRCDNTRITNYSGIDKLIDKMGGIIYVPEDSTHLLGVLLVKGLSRISITKSPKSEHILNKYLNMGTRDVLSAQDELIDAGYTKQARF